MGRPKGVKNKNPYPSDPIEKRLLKYVDKTENCWLWMGYRNKSGYGRLTIENKACIAHRVSYQLYKGTIPDGLFVCHSCDNPSCVNPNHLWLGTPQENTKDRDNKNRQVSGKGVHTARLTEEQVLEIRNKYIPGKYPQRRLAKEYGLAKSTVMAIVNGKSWKKILSQYSEVSNGSSRQSSKSR